MELLRKALIDGSFLLDLDERDMASICASDAGLCGRSRRAAARAT